MASSGIGATPVRPPGWPVPSPKELLNDAPSSVVLLKRESCPANDVPLDDACGVRRVKSGIVRLIVGSVPSAARGTSVAAPVRAAVSGPGAAPSTVTAERRVATGLSATETSVRLPSSRVRSSRVSGAKPRARTVTRYGPPIRMPGIT